MNQQFIKTRFCPSPTGLIHLGNGRTALFNALLAKKMQGIFLLRIEDTDKERSQPRYTEMLLQDLKWLGLLWQEGPGCEGQNGPYLQSKRQKIYDEYYARLDAKGLSYPCFCSAQQLALNKKIQQSLGKPPRYPGTCRSLTQEEIAQKLAQGIKPTLRFRVPSHEVIAFHDLVRGEQRYQSDEIGDFIIRRADGSAPFFYGNAIDDALMGVTHALRGEDHLTNTPRQLLILRALGLHEPNYGHIPLIVGFDGARLSKRHGSRSIQELKKMGFLPEAVINYLARLGHYYKDNSFMTKDELAKQFAIASLGHAAAHYDEMQLLYWQKAALQQQDMLTLWQWMEGAVGDLVPESSRQEFIKTIVANITFPQDAVKWAKIFFDDIIYDLEQHTILQQAGKEFFQLALETLQVTGSDFVALSQAMKENLGISGKMLFQPLRVAVTGELHGPEMIKVFSQLGVTKLQQRLQNAIVIAGKA